MTAETIFNILDRYGIPLLLVLAVGYALYKWIVPSIIKQLEQQQDYYRDEIKRLQSESREDRKLVMDLVKQGNENTLKLQNTLEKMNDRMDSMHREIGEVYKIVAKGKGLINGGDYYKEKE